MDMGREHVNSFFSRKGAYAAECAMDDEKAFGGVVQALDAHFENLGQSLKDVWGVEDGSISVIYAYNAFCQVVKAKGINWNM